MKVVAFNGSPRRDGNTASLVEHVFRVLRREGIDCELFQLAGGPIRGCTACYKCRENRDRRCVIEGDVVNECIQAMAEAEGIILASPTYFANLTPELKALIDRAGIVGKGNDNLYKRKIGAAVVAVRRAGAIHVFNSINHFFLINEMIIPGASYWNLGIGRLKGEVEEDEEGIRTMEVLGENMAWLLKRLHG